MKREGRQHGLVRTFQQMAPPWPQTANYRMMKSRLDDPPTAGMFSKVSPKPSNHSKFTSRCSRRKGCRGCHEHPVSKSKEKAKGTHKMKNGSDFKLVSWRVVDSGFGLRYVGSSASEFLNHLNNDDDGIVDENGLMGDPVIGSEDVKDDENDDEDETSYFDVGLYWEHVYEDEGWCLVG